MYYSYIAGTGVVIGSLLPAYHLVVYIAPTASAEVGYSLRKVPHPVLAKNLEKELFLFCNWKGFPNIVL
jgi:hypothetical protein